MFKKIFAGIIATAVVLTAVPSFEIISFAEELSSELTVSEPILLAEEDGVTREKWIHDLVSVFEMSVEDESTMEKYFTDTADSEYAYDIDLAANFGVFESDSNEFKPTENVTREFAAHTANYCLGYLDDETPVNLKDSDSIYYEYDAIVAVQKGWFTLSDGNFMPDSFITETEAENILEYAKSAQESIKVDENAENIITYADSVIQIEDTAKAVYLDGEVTISGTEKEIKAGDVFAVCVNDLIEIYKAVIVRNGLNGSIVIEIDEVDASEYIEDINIHGIGTVDYDNAIIYNDELNISSDESEDEVSEETEIETNYLRNSVEYLAKSYSININRSVNIGNLKIDLSGNISNITPEFRILSLSSIYMNISADANIKAKISGETKNSKSTEVKLATIPVTLDGVVSATVDAVATVSVSGSVTLSYNCSLGGGLSYEKGRGWRTTQNFVKKGFTLETEVSETVSLKSTLKVKLLGNLGQGSMYVMCGEKGTYYGKKQSDNTACHTIKAHVFAEVGADVKILKIPVYKTSYPIITEANSPLKLYLHWENGKKVDKCGYSDDGASTAKSKKAASYTKYTPYGTYYNGLIKYESSADYMADQRWTKETTLDKDVTVNGDLYVDHRLILNGHTLNVTGNLNVGPDGRVRMDSDSSKINVGADFITESNYYVGEGDKNYFRLGTITIGGDFYQKNMEVDNFSLSGTELKFTGTEPHIISSLNGGTDLNNFSPENNTLLKFRGAFGEIKLSSDITITDAMTGFYRININGYKLNVNGDFNQSGSIVMPLEKNGGGEINVAGNYTSYNGLSASSGKINIEGNCKWHSEELNIDSKSVINVGKDFSTDSGLILNGILNVPGNFTINGDGWLRLESDSSLLNVTGDFITESNHGLNYYTNDNKFSLGVIKIGKDFYQKNMGKDNFSLSGTELKFVGTEPHTVSSLDGGTDLNKFTSENNAVLNFRGAFGAIDLGGDITVTDAMTDFYSISLNGHKLTVNGDFNQTGKIIMTSNNESGGELNVTGDYIANGDLSITKGKVFIDGSCIWRDDSLDIDSDSIVTIKKDFTSDSRINLNGTLSIIGDFIINANGHLEMKSDFSKLCVGGNFITDSGYNCSEYYNVNVFKLGIVEISGNLYQKNLERNSFSLIGSKLKFVGEGKHIISAVNSDININNIILSKGAEVSFTGNMNGLSDLDKCTFTIADNGIAMAIDNNVLPAANGKTSVKISDPNEKESSIELTVEEMPENAVPVTTTDVTTAISTTETTVTTTETSDISTDVSTTSIAVTTETTTEIEPDTTDDVITTISVPVTSTDTDITTIITSAVETTDTTENTQTSTTSENNSSITETTNTVSLSQTELTLEIGKSDDISVENYNGSIEWLSSDTSIATVKNGIITAVAAGTVKIYAMTDNGNLICTVTVINKAALQGDISGNGKIDLYDAIEIAKSLIGVRKFTEEEKKIADFNGDGKVDLYDAIAIAKYMLKKS